MDIERYYCFIYWGYAGSFTDTLNASKQDLIFGGSKRKINNYAHNYETLNKSQLSSKLSRNLDEPQDFADSVSRAASKKTLNPVSDTSYEK